MTDGLRQQRSDAFRVVEGSGNGRGDRLAAVVPARLRESMPETIAPLLGNVVPFNRVRTGDTHAPKVALPRDIARPASVRTFAEQIRHWSFITASVVIHGSIFAYFVLREPEPLASIGVEVISAELLLGATAPAGAEQTQGEAQVNSQAATDPQETKAETEAEQKATEQSQNVQVDREEMAPEQTATLERQADERAPQDNAAAPREETAQAEPKYSVAMVENPNTPDMATATPKEIPPDTNEISLLPQPEEKPVETKPEPKKLQAAPPKPVKDAKKAAERKRIDAATREKASKQAKASNPSTAANSVGVGRSSNDTNYRGVVWAHLARYKGSASGSGTAIVAFTISGGGGVGGVRVTRSSGSPAVDQEAAAMVRRASPFPAPPGGGSRSFDIPVTYRAN
jgi:protein TonB